MAEPNIFRMLEALQSSQNPQDFQDAANRLQRKTSRLGNGERLNCLCLIAALQLGRWNNAEKSMQILQQALKISNITTQQRIEVLARMTANRFAVGQYSQGLLKHNEAVELCDTYPQAIHIIMGVYLKSQGFQVENGDTSQMLSLIYEVNRQTDQAIKYEKKALTSFSSEGANSESAKRFSEWRLAALRNSSLTMLSLTETREFARKNQALKKLVKFYPVEAAERGPSELQLEKSNILQKLTKAYKQYHQRPDLKDKANQLQKVITELNIGDLPLSMYGWSDKLQDSVGRSVDIPPLPLGTPSTGHRVTFNDSEYRKPLIPTTTSRMVSLQLDNANWEGSNLIKINFSSSGEEERYFYLKPGVERLYYCESKKSKSKSDDYYSLKDLKAVKVGKMTDTMLKKEHGSKDQSLCFSLELKDRSRDFYALNPQDHAIWVERLRDLLNSMQQKRNGKGQEQGSAEEQPRSRLQVTQVLPTQSAIPPSRISQSAKPSSQNPGTIYMSVKR